jgi:predicted nucleic acid-binding protein
MILYLDTSSLLKLFMDEPGAGEVVAGVESADIVATSVIAYAEAHAALGRRHREGAITKTEFHDLLARFRDAWLQVLSIALSAHVYTRAGPLAVQYALRGMDAIHLSSYVELLSQGGVVEFLSHDTRLMDAATKQRRRYHGH